MNKNKTLNIKIIFKIYFKILKHKLKYFGFSKRFLYSKHHKINKKTIFKNCFLKPLHSIMFFFKIYILFLFFMIFFYSLFFHPNKKINFLLYNIFYLKKIYL